mgnify:CR=1 FL=1|tara:strand:+ start:2672 stop:2890 length:219 start_codon:yes stop_codon:yes gene_type:complete
MTKEPIDYKYWLGLAAFVFSISTVIFYGGKSQQKLDNLIATTSKIEKQIPQLSERVDRHELRISLLEERTKK